MENIYVLLRPIDFAVVLVYLLVLIGLGYWVSFGKKKKRDENLFLAGHSLGWPSIGFTMWGTNVGPSMLVASASIGYTTGIVAGNFGWYAFLFIFLLAVVFAPRYLGARVQTLPEFMGKRFGQSTRNILAWYTIATVLISWLRSRFYAGGILVGQILNLAHVVVGFRTDWHFSFFTIAGV
jgi:SSS family solute:Na+ symporter